MEHSLVENRVEEESDRLSNTNPNLLTAKHLADIVRTVEVGVSRRISKRLEDELIDRQVAERTMRFLDVLVDSFPEFQAIEKGELSSPELRRSSLLGSSTMLRVLAGVYHDLPINEDEPGDRMSDGEVSEFLKKLAPHMYAPISEEGAWKATGRVHGQRNGAPVEPGRCQETNQHDPRSGEEPAWLAVLAGAVEAETKRTPHWMRGSSIPLRGFEPRFPD
jgi:DndB-like DNA-sulfur modification-associated protein